MDDYSKQLEEISKAKSLDDIQRIAREFPATANGEGGALYSGKVGATTSHDIVLELSENAHLNIIDNTPRAKFLSDPNVDASIKNRVRSIAVSEGVAPAEAGKFANDFLYGNADVPLNNPTSLKNCVWGRASNEFAQSLRGDIDVVASAASPKRVFGQVEVPTVLNNPNVRSLGGEPVANLRHLQAHGGTEAVLTKVQEPFVRATAEPVFNAPSGKGVTLSKEFVHRLGVDSKGFATAAELEGYGLARVNTGYTAPHVAVATGVSAAKPANAGARPQPGETAPKVMAPETVVTGEGLTPKKVVTPEGVSTKVGKVAGVAGAVAVAVDATQTANRTTELLGQKNSLGAQSQVIHFGSRNLSMLGGAALGTELGAAAGIETGPGALLTGAAGGIVGAIGGNKLADAIDHYRVYTQKGSDGNRWHLDPDKPSAGWQRYEMEIDPNPAVPSFDGMSIPMKMTAHTADARLSNELNYKASGAAVELALASAPTPEDPYKLKAAAGDTHSIAPRSWVRDPATHQWSREVADEYIEHGMLVSHTEKASPQRAAQLDRQAEAAIAKNSEQSMPAIANRYQQAYQQFGWSKLGGEPEAVATAQNMLKGSDGYTYTRGNDGNWTGRGFLGHHFAAEGNVKDELNATYKHLQDARTQAGPHADARDSRGQTQAQPGGRSELAERLERMTNAAQNGDWAALRNDTQALAQTQPAQQLLASAKATANQQEQAAAQPQAQQPSQQDNPTTRGPQRMG
jgi:hypothetical protein